MRIHIPCMMVGWRSPPLMRKLSIRKNPMAGSSRNSRWSLRRRILVIDPLTGMAVQAIPQ